VGCAVGVWLHREDLAGVDGPDCPSECVRCPGGALLLKAAALSLQAVAVVAFHLCRGSAIV